MLYLHHHPTTGITHASALDKSVHHNENKSHNNSTSFGVSSKNVEQASVNHKINSTHNGPLKEVMMQDVENR